MTSHTHTLHLTLIDIIPRIWTHYRTPPNTSPSNQGPVQFWFHANVTVLSRGKSKWLATTAPCSKWRTISPFITTPSVTKPATENAYMTRFVFFAEPPCNPLNPFNRRAKKKCWRLPLVLFNNCFVVQDVQEMSLLLSLKTLESVYMHCELGKFLSFYILHTVSQKSADIGLRLCLLLCGHLYE